MKTSEEKDMEALRQARKQGGPALSFGMTFAVGMVVFALSGNWLGRKYGNEKLGTLVGVTMGLVFGGYELWKLIHYGNLAASDAEVSDESA